MRDRKLASRYARALLGALPNAADQLTSDAFLAMLARALEESGELRGFLLDPASSATSKKSVLQKMGEGKSLPARLLKFLDLLVDNGRVASIPSIAEVFHAEREAGQGEVSARLITAAPLTPDLTDRARQALQKLSGRKVNLELSVDPALLGGAVARIGSMVYDGSLRTQLHRLRRQMGEE